MGGKPSAPSVPNPQKVAAAQTESNVETATANAWMNNVDTYGPLGSSTFKVQGYKLVEIPQANGKIKRVQVPIFEQHNRLSDDQQELLDLQERAGANLGETAVQQSRMLQEHLRGGINENRLPDQVKNAPNAPNLAIANGITPSYRDSLGNAGPIQKQIGADDFSADRRRVEEALMSRLDPQLERDRSALETRLANQGITNGSEAWNRALDQHGRNVNDARMQTITAGGAEQSRLFGMDEARGQFANQAQAQDFTQSSAQNQFYNQTQQQRASDQLRQAEHGNSVRLSEFNARNQAAENQQTLRQQALQEQIALRNQPLSEIAQLLHGSSPTLPQFQQWNQQQIANTPVGQYHYQSAALEQQQYAAQMQQQNAMMGGLFGLGSAGLGMFSDERLKKNIRRIATLKNGIGVYSYTMGGIPQIGLIAQEVEKLKPEAVNEIGGFKTVRYDLAVEA